MLLFFTISLCIILGRYDKVRIRNLFYLNLSSDGTVVLLRIPYPRQCKFLSFLVCADTNDQSSLSAWYSLNQIIRADIKHTQRKWLCLTSHLTNERFSRSICLIQRHSWLMMFFYFDYKYIIIKRELYNLTIRLIYSTFLFPYLIKLLSCSKFLNLRNCYSIITSIQ